jgi:aspartate 1-decarboxylase
MFLEYLHSKIHMAVITDAKPDYVGSLTVDPDLLDAAGMTPFQKILVANSATGQRFETYIIEGSRGSGEICLNGAAARMGSPGDKVIIMSFCALTPQAAATHRPTVVQVREGNRPAVDVAAPAAV